MGESQRFLFVVPPLAGHVNPAAGVVRELRRRGHDVAWVAHEDVVGPLLGEGATVYPAGDRFIDQIIEHLPERERIKGPASLQFLWEKVLVPLTLDMVRPVRAAVDDFAPDVVVADQQAFAGAIVAAERDLAWAVSATSSAGFVDPLVRMPKIGDWMRNQLDGLYDRLGMPGFGDTGFDPRQSPHLTIEYSTPELVGEAGRDLASVAFVGPVLTRPSTPVPFPWEWLDRHDTNLLVTLGTVSHAGGVPFLSRVLEAVTGRPYGVVMVGPAELLPPPPGNVLVRPYVPQLDLLPRLDAVVCHAGQNTVCEALSFGLPLVCAPIRDDQPLITGQVVRAGAGRRVSFARARPADVASAIDAVLEDPSHRAAAGRIADSFRAAGGAPAAADRLETLVRSVRGGPAPRTARAAP